MKKYYLDYKPEFEAFCVEDAIISAFDYEGELPVLELSEGGYQMLGCAVPAAEAPTIGFLMGRDVNCFSAGKNYVLALAKTGMNIRFLTYKHCKQQLEACDGLCLPGGAFPSPERYYTDPRQKPNRREKTYPSVRSRAYVECIDYAIEHDIPVLGICAGAQMIAGEFGLKLYRNQDYLETPLRHKSSAPAAHRLHVFPDNPLSLILKGGDEMMINSRHNEMLAPVKVQREFWAHDHKKAYEKVELPMDIYAEANDGVPEAWGREDLFILCVQWHPEDMAAAGDELMQGIFQWLADAIVRAKNRPARETDE